MNSSSFHIGGASNYALGPLDFNSKCIRETTHILADFVASVQAEFYSARFEEEPKVAKGVFKRMGAHGTEGRGAFGSEEGAHCAPDVRWPDSRSSERGASLT
jgi:hypothetical protein